MASNPPPNEPLGMPGVPPQEPLPSWAIPPTAGEGHTHPSTDRAPWDMPNYDPRVSAGLYSEALSNRPIFVWIFSILAWLGGGILLLSSLAFFFLASSPDLASNPEFQNAIASTNYAISPTEIFMATGIFAVVVGSFYLIITWFFFAGHRWAWWTLIVLTTLGAASALISLHVSSILLQAFTFLLLLWPSTRQWCKAGF